MKKLQAKRHILTKEVHCSLIGALGVILSFSSLSMISRNRNFLVEFAAVVGLSFLAVAATWIHCNIKQSRTRREIAEWAKKFYDPT